MTIEVRSLRKRFGEFVALWFGVVQDFLRFFDQDRRSAPAGVGDPFIGILELVENAMEHDAVNAVRIAVVEFRGQALDRGAAFDAFAGPIEDRGMRILELVLRVLFEPDPEPLFLLSSCH